MLTRHKRGKTPKYLKSHRLFAMKFSCRIPGNENGLTQPYSSSSSSSGTPGLPTTSTVM
jgi:hypothetical protein